MRAFIGIVVFASFSAIQAWAQVAIIPSGPAISAASPALIPSSPALTVPAPNPGLVTNMTLVSLADLLLALQGNLQQTLPVLTMFNNNFDFVSLGDNGRTATTAPNAGANFGANAATNFAGNFAVNAATPTGIVPQSPAAPALNPAAAGLPSGVVNVPVTRETLRALLVLQGDIQRMLPIVNALNVGTASYPNSFTNLFSIVPASP